MSIVFTFGDLVADLQALIDGRLNDETICLFKGNHKPGPGDTTFTYLGIEGNFGGYQRFALVFSAAAPNDDSIPFTKSQIQEWLTADTINLPQTIGGVFALDSAGALAWADRLPKGPVTLTLAGQAVVYQAVIEQGP